MSISTAGATELLQQDVPTPWLLLLTITHPTMPTPIRLSSDGVDTISNGQLFQHFPFELILPDDVEGRAPQAQLRIDNTSQEIVAILRGLTTPPSLTIQIVRSAILITANNITDLLTADQAGAAVDYNVGILIYQFSYLPHNVIVRGNNLAQRTAATNGLTWSQIKPRGIAGENRQWRRDTPTGNVMFYDTTMTGEVFVGRASAMRIEAPNALDRLTFDVDENRIDGFSEDDFVRSQSAAWDGAPELWAVPASVGEFPIEPARFTGLDLRGYRQMRLVLNVGGQAGLTGTILYYRYSLDGGATWYDTDAAIQLDGSVNQAFRGNWQPIPPMLRQSIDTTVALFGRDGDGSTVVELVDWFVLDIRGVDHTSAARLLPTKVTPAEIADPVETDLRSFSPKDIADIVAALIP